MNLWLIKLQTVLVLILVFFREVFSGAINLLVIIYRGPDKVESDFFEIKPQLQSETAVVILAHFITLTPGTLSVNISSDRRILIHILDKSKIPDVKRLIRHRLEPKLQLLWRRS